MVIGSSAPKNIVSELSQLGPVTVNGTCSTAPWSAREDHSGNRH